jgi:RNA polymerase sigma-70 factor (ECF subfamily)
MKLSDETSDGQLLEGVVEGRPSCFELLYVRYGDRLYRFAIMISGSQNLAEDATHDTFVYVIEHAKMFDSTRSDSALGWLYGITRNCIRALARGGAKPLLAIQQEPATRTLAEMMGLSCAVTATLSAIVDLDIDQREVVVLCCLQELSYDVVAEILLVPVGTVRSRLSRARQSLRQSLHRDTGMTFLEITNEA